MADQNVVRTIVPDSFGNQNSQFALGNTPDLTEPQFVNSSIGPGGNALLVNYDAAVEFGAGGNTGFTISPSGGAATLNFNHQPFSTRLVFGISRTIGGAETVTLSYENPTDGVQNTTGVDAPDLTAEPVTNNSGSNSVVSQSHWIQSGLHNNNDAAWINGISNDTIQHFDVIQMVYLWSHVEGAGSGTTSGTFDFSAFASALSAISARGKRATIKVNWRKFDTNTHSTPFGDTSDVMPSDLVADYQYTSGPGPNSAMYVPTVRIRFEKMLKAVIDQFGSDPAFIGTQSPETSGQDDAPSATYAVGDFVTQLNTLWKNIAAYDTGLYFIPVWNFLAGAATKALAGPQWTNALDGVPTANVILDNPDILLGGPNYPPLASRVYTFVHPDFDGTVHAINNYIRMGNMEFDSHRLDQNGNVDMHELFTSMARDTLHYDIVKWTYTNSEDFTFDAPRTGKTSGDDEAVAGKLWGDAYDPAYAD